MTAGRRPAPIEAPDPAATDLMKRLSSASGSTVAHDLALRLAGRSPLTRDEAMVWAWLVSDSAARIEPWERMRLAAIIEDTRPLHDHGYTDAALRKLGFDPTAMDRTDGGCSC